MFVKTRAVRQRTRPRETNAAVDPHTPGFDRINPPPPQESPKKQATPQVAAEEPEPPRRSPRHPGDTSHTACPRPSAPSPQPRYKRHDRRDHGFPSRRPPCRCRCTYRSAVLVEVDISFQQGVVNQEATIGRLSEAGRWGRMARHVLERRARCEGKGFTWRGRHRHRWSGR